MDMSDPEIGQQVATFLSILGFSPLALPASVVLVIFGLYSFVVAEAFGAWA